MLTEAEQLLRRVNEAACAAVENSPNWQKQFEQLCRHKHKNLAIVAIARKLLVAIWHVWHAAVCDKHADEPFVARKILAWAERLNADQRAEPSTGAFIRRRLQLLGLGASIKAVPRGPNRSVPLPDATTA